MPSRRKTRRPIPAAQLALAVLVAFAAVALGWLVAGSIRNAPQTAANGGMSTPCVPAQLILKTDGEAGVVNAPQCALPAERLPGASGAGSRFAELPAGPRGARAAMREFAPLHRRPPPALS
ncbi:MAG: hypothetical protein HY821_10450 [Acidobacteria bacterium]|nr:hypothetical protein [Acidobacteriota bacterium]